VQLANRKLSNIKGDFPEFPPDFAHAEKRSSFLEHQKDNVGDNRKMHPDTMPQQGSLHYYSDLQSARSDKNRLCSYWFSLDSEVIKMLIDQNDPNPEFVRNRTSQLTLVITSLSCVQAEAYLIFYRAAGNEKDSS
jgi:hypothetical protein